VRPVKSVDLALRRYSTYCLVDAISKKFRGPISMSIGQLVAQLERMGVWEPAEKYSKKDPEDRR
jgi:hypothetical protein